MDSGVTLLIKLIRVAGNFNLIQENNTQILQNTVKGSRIHTTTSYETCPRF